MSKHSAHDTRWNRLRAEKLTRNPICEHDGCRSPATSVDHIQPQSTHPELRYSWPNLRALCDTHHLGAHGKRRRNLIDPATGWNEA